MMITKFISVPSPNMNGRSDVLRFNVTKNDYEFCKDNLPTYDANELANSLNEEYILDEITERFLRHPSNQHLFVDKNVTNHFYILKNYAERWDDVILIEFCNNEVKRVLYGSIQSDRTIMCQDFFRKWYDIYTSGYSEHILEDFFPDSASIINSRVKEIVDGVNRK